MTAPSRDVRWWEQAKPCDAVDPDAMHPQATDHAAVRRALRVCRGCPVTEPCLAEALRVGDVEGVRGGRTGAARAAMIAARLPLGVCPDCGRDDVRVKRGTLGRHWRPGEGPAFGNQTCPGSGWVG